MANITESPLVKMIDALSGALCVPHKNLHCGYIFSPQAAKFPTTQMLMLVRDLHFDAFIRNNCRSLKKVKFSTDQFRPALGSGCCLIVTMLKKPQNCPISDFFDLTLKYFLLLLHYTDQVPPSTDSVPPSTNQYCPILT